MPHIMTDEAYKFPLKYGVKFALPIISTVSAYIWGIPTFMTNNFPAWYMAVSTAVLVFFLPDIWTHDAYKSVASVSHRVYTWFEWMSPFQAVETSEDLCILHEFTGVYVLAHVVLHCITGVRCVTTGSAHLLALEGSMRVFDPWHWPIEIWGSLHHENDVLQKRFVTGTTCIDPGVAFARTDNGLTGLMQLNWGMQTNGLRPSEAEGIRVEAHCQFKMLLLVGFIVVLAIRGVKVFLEPTFHIPTQSTHRLVRFISSMMVGMCIQYICFQHRMRSRKAPPQYCGWTCNIVRDHYSEFHMWIWLSPYVGAGIVASVLWPALLWTEKRIKYMMKEHEKAKAAKAAAAKANQQNGNRNANMPQGQQRQQGPPQGQQRQQGQPRQQGPPQPQPQYAPMFPQTHPYFAVQLAMQQQFAMQQQGFAYQFPQAPPPVVQAQPMQPVQAPVVHAPVVQAPAPAPVAAAPRSRGRKRPADTGTGASWSRRSRLRSNG
jgi:hypothetical protein